MKKYKLRYLPTANLDLIEIDKSMAETPAKAIKFFSSLDKQAVNLVNMPRMYPIYDDVPIYRKLIVMGYLVFYVINKDGETIDIHRIIHSRMDVMSNLLADD